MRSYIPARHLETIQRPQYYPRTKSYPQIESDYTPGESDTLSILSALFDLADPSTGVIAPNVCTRLFIYKELFQLYKPFYQLCGRHLSDIHPGQTNSYVIKQLKHLGFTPFKTEDPGIPNCWVKAGEYDRFTKHPSMVSTILEETHRELSITHLQRLEILSSPARAALFNQAREKADNILKEDLERPADQRQLDLRSVIAAQTQIAHDAEQLTVFQRMLEHIS